MSKFKYLLLLACILLTACEPKPVKLTLLNTELVTVNYNYSEDNGLFYEGSTGKPHIKLYFLSDTPVVAVKGAGVVMSWVYTDRVNEDVMLNTPVRYAYRTKLGTNQIFDTGYDSQEIEDIEGEYRLDGYLRVDATRPDSTWVNLLEDDYKKLVLVVTVAQTYGVMYASNEVAITKEQILKAVRIAEPVVIEVLD